MEKKQMVEKKAFCPAKDKYERIYTEACDCLYCDGKDVCWYWTTREKDKETKKDDYKCYLLRG